MKNRGIPTKVFLPMDFLKGKEKREYIHGGDIVSTNIYDDLENVPSYEELDTMEKEEATKILKAIKIRHSNISLIKYWNVNNYKGYKLFKKLGLVDGHPHNTIKPKNIDSNQSNMSKNNEIAFKGLRIVFAGEYNSSVIDDRVKKILSTLDSESKYKVVLEIEEVKNK